MAANSDGTWVVLLTDIVGSSQVKNLRQVRDEALARLSKRHLAEHRVLARYTVTAWDEFQNVLAHAWELPEVIWGLRLAFYPLELRIGAGFGTIDGVPGPHTPINEVSSGPAFMLARDAVSRLEKERHKYPVRTMIRCEDQALEGIVNLIYMLADSILAGLSRRQWETIQAYHETGRQDEAAERLGVKSESTVSRNLQRACYWQMVDAQSRLREILRLRFASEDTT